jgi:UDP-N-acetylmuramoylalanine--D-glutamate ligase
MNNNRWLGKRVLIIGAARQGTALARFLSARSAKVTLNDRQSPEKLKSVEDSLKDLSIKCVFGGHALELLDQTDLVCISGGIPLNNPIVEAAVKRSIPLSNDSQIFLEEVHAPVIAITGSAGKTTTTALVGKIAETATPVPHKAWVGGNIGLPLIEYIDEIKPNDIVILEISSFQLDQMTISPHIGAVLNITPNHLDRHGTMEAYTASKARLLQFQTRNDIAVLNREDPGSWGLQKIVHGNLVSFGTQEPSSGLLGAWLNHDRLVIKTANGYVDILRTTDIKLRGPHNVMNVLAACAISFAAGFSRESMQHAVRHFNGVAHRLEFVRDCNGSKWYNDSIATAPERTMAAIRSFSEPIVLLLGGRDKDLPWNELANLIHLKVDHVIVFGESAEKILDALGPVKASQKPVSLTRVLSMQEAVYEASVIAESGDIVLLSPGGTSFDEFDDFEERGDKFRKWVTQLP